MSAVQRIRKELDKYIRSPSQLWTLNLYDNDILTWYVIIRNIPSKKHYDKEYNIRIDFTSDYPFKPPRFVFLSDIKSRFVHNNTICIDILQDNWSPVLTIDSIIVSICSLLSDENESTKYLPNNDDHMEILAKRFKAI
jgi:ubiquitin-conjugating enzyme E2 D/E